MTLKTMRGDRLHIGFFGRRNVGKSSLINAMTGQNVAIVSEIPGTTTDPVYKSMELLPLGPVVLIDTAGIDDRGDPLGIERKRKAKEVINKTDLALLVIDSSATDLSYEDKLLNTFKANGTPFLIVANKADRGMGKKVKKWLGSKPFLSTSVTQQTGIKELKKRILEIAPREWEPPLLRDLIRPGDVVLLVTPIDLSAPAGRLIMPQVKALRDILDGDGIPVICKERELLSALKALVRPPALVITDSQVFPQVAADVPENILMTSFSILSIRQKGDLASMVEGVLAVKNLKPGDRVLIAESCTHHPLEDDIGRVKIPRWLNSYVGGGLKIDTVPGSRFPDHLKRYKLVVHCGACTLNRRDMLRRQAIPARLGIPMTNYGVLIAFLKSVFPRALKPFPGIQAQFEKKGSGAPMVLKKRMAKMTEV